MMHVTFSADPDAELLALAGELSARSRSCEDTLPLCNAGCEVRQVHPSIDLGVSSLQSILNAFVKSLGSPYVPRPAPSDPFYSPKAMGEIESLLWGWFVGGVVCEMGAFDGDPQGATEWITRWLLRLDADGGSRHFRVRSLFDVRGIAECTLVVTPRRVAMVYCIGWD